MKITILLLIPLFNIVCNVTKPDNSSRKHWVRSENWSLTHITFYQLQPVQPSHGEPTSRTLAQSALKPSLSLALMGQKSRLWLCCQWYPVCLTGRHREMYAILKISHSLRKKFKTISHGGGGGRERKILQIDEMEELSLLLALLVMRNVLISHLFPKCHEGRKKGVEASLIGRWDYSKPRRESHESLPLLIVTAHLLFLLPALPQYPDGIKDFEVSPCFAMQRVYSRYASWKSHQCL